MKPLHFSGAVIISLTGAASAAIVLEPTRAGMNADDLVLWEQLPISDDGFLNIEQPFTVTSTLGMDVDVSVVGGGPDFTSIFTFEEGGIWFGNFNNGERLIYSFQQEPISLNFENPVSRVGFNIQPGFDGEFMGHIEAFGVDDASLGIFSGTGFSDTVEGSALFLGVSNDVANIKSIVISVSGGEAADFAINQVSLSTRVPLTSIPEPSPVLVLGGLLAGSFMSFRQRKAA